MDATPGNLTALTALDVGQLEWRSIPNCRGVFARELSQRTGVTVALVGYAPGAATPGHPHPNAEHHIWVLSGDAMFAGRRVASGSYLFVAAGVAHPIIAGATGCTLLQIHVPAAARSSAPLAVPAAA